MNAIVKAVHIIRKDFHKLETDPYTQLSYHRRMVIFWLWQLPFILILIYFNIRAILSGQGTKLALLLDAIMFSINTIYSWYALVCTEMGDAHASYASVKSLEIQRAQKPAAAVFTEAGKNLEHAEL